LNFETFSAHQPMMAADEQPLDAEFALEIYGAAFSLSSRSFLSHSKGNGTRPLMAIELLLTLFIRPRSGAPDFSADAPVVAPWPPLSSAIFMT
jgi:hypothetical protein